MFAGPATLNAHRRGVLCAATLGRAAGRTGRLEATSRTGRLAARNDCFASAMTEMALGSVREHMHHARRSHGDRARPHAVRGGVASLELTRAPAETHDQELLAWRRRLARSSRRRRPPRTAASRRAAPCARPRWKAACDRPVVAAAEAHTSGASRTSTASSSGSRPRAMLWSPRNDRVRLHMEATMKRVEWINRYNYWIAPKPTMPGVWRRKEGGYFVRGRAVDPRTGKKREVQ